MIDRRHNLDYFVFGHSSGFVSDKNIKDYEEHKQDFVHASEDKDFLQAIEDATAHTEDQVMCYDRGQFNSNKCFKELFDLTTGRFKIYFVD